MADYPKINGKVYSFSSIDFNISAIGRRTVGVQAINYKASLKPGIVRGSSPKKNGRTLGTYEPSASMTLYKEDADELIDQLGDGFGETQFDINIVFAEDFMPISTVFIKGARISDFSEDNKEGEEATMTTFELDVMDVLINNKSLVRQDRR